MPFATHPENQKDYMRQIILFLSVVILTLQSCSNTNTKEPNEISLENKPSETLPKYTEEEKNSMFSDMKKVISDFSTENTVRDLNDAKLQLQRLGFAWYQCYGRLIEAKANTSIWKMKDTAIAVLSKYQNKMFPKYRKAFTEETDKKLWIEDCSAYISGDNNDIINLVGLAFAPNRYKQESYKTLLKVLKQYRFKKITFRTFKSSNNITSYDLTSDTDTEYVQMQE